MKALRKIRILLVAAALAVAAIGITGCKNPAETQTVYETALPDGTYTVYHLQQRTTGGKGPADYVLQTSDTETDKAVKADTMLSALAKTYPGFTAKSMSRNESAVYVFYDRNEITYTLNTGEGTFTDGTKTKEAKGLFGAAVNKPKVSELRAPEGKTFYRWVVSSDKSTVPPVFGAENIVIEAEWVEKNKIPEGFRKIPAISIKGTEKWAPHSWIFVSGRALEIKSFYMSDHQVTRAEYKEVMGSLPSDMAKAHDKGGNKLTGDAAGNNPVNKVSWYDAIVYCNKRSIKENLTPCYKINDKTDPADWGTVPTSSDSTWNAATCDFTADGYRLPTEAEWEWAARGGDGYEYAGSDTIDEVAWYADNTNETGTRDVKTKKENSYGLYDMSGNVWEWCWDWYENNISSGTPASGSASGSDRCLRGGSWGSGANYAQVAFRIYYNPYDRSSICGFRLVRCAN
ncbi:SUMF1/EgtB/PvdO family nonheme iron enzyme [Treponema socranskii]|uniref:formylglycine-generating enzyme family protein n=1 Tax=Treponema socranskii TaxID=53419 RepID=UPI003D93993F